MRGRGAEASGGGAEAEQEEHTLAFLLEGQLALLVVILILSSTPVFSSLWWRWSARGSSRGSKRDIGHRGHLTFPLFLGMVARQILMS